MNIQIIEAGIELDSLAMGLLRLSRIRDFKLSVFFLPFICMYGPRILNGFLKY